MQIKKDAGASDAPGLVVADDQTVKTNLGDAPQYSMSVAGRPDEVLIQEDDLFEVFERSVLGARRAEVWLGAEEPGPDDEMVRAEELVLTVSPGPSAVRLRINLLGTDRPLPLLRPILANHPGGTPPPPSPDIGVDWNIARSGTEGGVQFYVVWLRAPDVEGDYFSWDFGVGSPDLDFDVKVKRQKLTSAMAPSLELIDAGR